MRALSGIGERDIAADAAAGAGDKRHLVLQSHGVPPRLKITRKNHAKSASAGIQGHFRPRKWWLRVPSLLLRIIPAAKVLIMAAHPNKWPSRNATITLH